MNTIQNPQRTPPEGKIRNKDYEFFTANMGSLYSRYGQKFVVIKNQKIIGVHDTFEAALDETTKTEKLGTFLIQECFKNIEESICHNLYVSHHNPGGVAYSIASTVSNGQPFQG